jgi:LacI family transcriptional regulator
VKITRLDVAREAGVSSAVVSYVINNGPRPVAAETRARVEKAINDLGYRPNVIASALRGGLTHSVGFLTPNPRNPFHAQMAEAIERTFLARGYLVITGNTYYDRAREERLLRTFLDRRVDGLILNSGITLASSLAPTLGDVPVLSLDAAQMRGIPTISADETADAATAVEHLQRHGHRLIAHIAGPPHLRGEELKTRGWRRQQDSHSSPSGDELIAYAESSEEGGSSAAGLLLGSRGRPTALHDQRPTALFVSSDVQAIGAISACRQLGVAVPQDVAIVSLGGTRAAGYTQPPLTTVRQDFEFIAATAASRLLDQIKDPGSAGSDLMLTGNLVVGESCGCPTPTDFS